MERSVIGAIGVGLALLLIFLRVPIGVAMGLVGLGGIAALSSWNAAFGIAKTIPYELIGDWNLSAVPMFLLMGYVASATGLTPGLFAAARIFLGHVPGPLASATVLASAFFASASGSSVATAAAFSRISVPEMLKAKYDPALATGCVASAGTLGSLIPPSILMIIFGIMADVSISRLFMAGVVPGILSALVFIGCITIGCMLNPRLAPPVHALYSRAQKRGAAPDVLAPPPPLLPPLPPHLVPAHRGRRARPRLRLRHRRVAPLAEQRQLAQGPRRYRRRHFGDLHHRRRGGHLLALHVLQPVAHGHVAVAAGQPRQPTDHGAGDCRDLPDPGLRARKRLDHAADHALAAAAAHADERRPGVVRHPGDQAARDRPVHAARGHERLRRQERAGRARAAGHHLSRGRMVHRRRPVDAGPADCLPADQPLASRSAVQVNPGFVSLTTLCPRSRA